MNKSIILVALLSTLLSTGLSLAQPAPINSQFQEYDESPALFEETSSLKSMPSDADTGFSYQGELLKNGVPANINYDFSFQLWDAETGGTQLGATVVKGNRAVTNGFISIDDIRFGILAYLGNNNLKWLRVTVRETGNPGSETSLTPRQRIHAVPYAVQADYLAPHDAMGGDVLQFNGTDWVATALGGGSSPWTVAGSDINFTTGEVTIGSQTSSALLTLGVANSSGGDILRAMVGSSTAFYVDDNNGVGVGSWNTPPINGLRVLGQTQLWDDLTVNSGGLTRLARTTDASLVDGSGALIIGNEAGLNLALDGNEVLARDNGAASPLFIGASGSVGTHVNGTDSAGLLAIGASVSQMTFDGDDIQRRANGSPATMFLNFYGGDVRIGSAGATTTIQGTFVNSSDKNLKKDIEDLPYGLAEIMVLKPKAYYWKNSEKQHKSFGLIAQDVQEVMQELVHTSESKDEAQTKTLALSYLELVPVMINAIQQQQAIIDEQGKQIALLLKLQESQ